MHTHNIHLEWLVEGGAIALALFLAMIALWGRQAWRAWPQWKGDAVITALAITLVLRLWPVNAQTSQFAAWSAVAFWLFVGWLLAELAARRATR